MENKDLYVSVVIPTYNEEMRKEKMEAHLKSIGEYFSGKGMRYEVVIALDGPTDNTASLVKAHAQNMPNIRVLDRTENKGKGYTLREGMVQAQGDIVLFTDMDGATPIRMLDKFLPKFQDENFDIVIGSRDMAGADVKVHQPKWKEFLGNAGNLLIQMIGGLWGMRDTQCGFKAFTKEAVADIFPRTTVDRWGLDFELLMIGKKLGYKIVEVPIEWIDSGDSTVGIMGYISTFRDLFRVKFNMICGVYKLGKSVEEMKK